MRQLVSYEDIASDIPAKVSLPNSGPGLPPKKRRKDNHRRGHRAQYLDEDDEDEDKHKALSNKMQRDYGLEEESRQLTYEEVWDDSALIRAWDAAVEEYEVLNGPEKKWKSEPVNKSPLWFNIPPKTEAPSTSLPGPSFLMPSMAAAFTSGSDVEQDKDIQPPDSDNSRPVNFDTFVPRHDPSLPNANQGADDDVATRAWHGIVPPSPAGMTSQVTSNEAFERAMGAWYWAGYWTGVYQTGVNQKVRPNSQRHDHESETMDEAAVGNIEQEEQEVPSEQVEEGDLIPT